jgi:hypothetical protein
MMHVYMHVCMHVCLEVLAKSYDFVLYVPSKRKAHVVNVCMWAVCMFSTRYMYDLYGCAYQLHA